MSILCTCNAINAQILISNDKYVSNAEEYNLDLREEVTGRWRNHIMRSFIICTHLKLFE